MVCGVYKPDLSSGAGKYKGRWFKGLYFLLPPLPPPPVEGVDLDFFVSDISPISIKVVIVNEERWGNKLVHELNFTGSKSYQSTVSIYPLPIWKGRILCVSDKAFDFYFQRCDEPALIINGLNFRPVPCYFYSLSYDPGDIDIGYLE